MNVFLSTDRVNDKPTLGNQKLSNNPPEQLLAQWIISTLRPTPRSNGLMTLFFSKENSLI